MSQQFLTYPAPKRFKVYVTWVDHGTFVKDARLTPSLSNFSSEVGRNFHVSGFRLDGSGDYFKYNVVIPQEVQGSFKVPQIGDVIIVEEDIRNQGESPLYVYSTYNDLPREKSVSSPIPAWGEIPGDYGHLRSHLEHNAQFLDDENDFTKRYIKSVTGYRFRRYYGHVYNTKTRFLDKGKFGVRGDVVFDIETGSSNMSEPEIIDSGVNVVSTKETDNTLEKDLAKYPNPLNVPVVRASDNRYRFSSEVPRLLPEQIESNAYKAADDSKDPAKDVFYVNTYRNKNYFSYQPIIDEKYRDYLKNLSSSSEEAQEDFKRELPVAEEYQVSLRGNNKLLIQDQFGNGEQLLITLKNQYDSGFTILHNYETSNIRMRDHLGQGVLIEGDPEHPRVVSWTTERQVSDMGSIRKYEFDPETNEVEIESYGEYAYIRNGSVYGLSDTNFGRITEEEIPRDGTEEEPVPQQEWALLNAKTSDSWDKLFEGISSRLSSGMQDFVSLDKGNGLFFRNNFDPKETEQLFSIYNDFSEVPVLTTRSSQSYDTGSKLVSSSFSQVVDGASNISYTDKKNLFISGSSKSTSTEFDYVDSLKAEKTFSLNRNDLSKYSEVHTTKGDVSESHTINEYGTSKIYTDRVADDSVNTKVIQEDDAVVVNVWEMDSDFIKSTQNDSSGQVVNVIEQNGENEFISREQYKGGNLNNVIKQEPDLIESILYDNFLVNNVVRQSPDSIESILNSGSVTESIVEQMPSTIVQTQYSGGSPYTMVEQNASSGSINIERLNSGININLGSSSGGNGIISIGRSDDTVVINGNSVDVDGTSLITLTAPTININGQTTTITGTTLSVDANDTNIDGGNIDISGSSIDFTESS